MSHRGAQYIDASPRLHRLGRQMLTKLKVYAGPTHPHAAQQPQPLALEDARARV